MQVRYSYLKQQFSNTNDLWKKLKKFVDTGDFTLGKELTIEVDFICRLYWLRSWRIIKIGEVC